MFDFLNRFGLPVKYAVLCFAGGFLGVFLAKTFGYGSDTINYISTPIAAAVGGAIGGWLRQRKGRTD
ncbi:hypothetical protein ACLHDG_12125 [Sulfurovum sp. CS9]|uniref:hypothetical protein n=1 Tax=Sulfurovum sp. CS9 TaxID=3391146 RepID=UPI0039EA6648